MREHGSHWRIDIMAFWGFYFLTLLLNPANLLIESVPRSSANAYRYGMAAT
jgi:hypothetical protein